MPRERALSEAKEPHPVILKVLRLCRPTLSTHPAAPLPTTPSLPTAPSLLAPIPAEDDTFPLQPLLTLPPSFGNVFIGETFRCCLHASITSELPDGVTVSNVRVEAEMQTPAQKLGLELMGEDARIVEFELKEEGLHVLAVTVSYLQSLAVPPLPESGETPSTTTAAATTATRERSFRKLYQFTSSHCLLIRTKATLLPSSSPSQSLILEAQIENVSDSPLVLSELTLNGPRPAETLYHNDDEDRAMPLKSRDVVQVAFLVGEEEEGGEAEAKEKGIGQLVLKWRSACGELGILRTGRLGAPASVVG